MKKTILFIALALLLGGTATAQEGIMRQRQDFSTKIDSLNVRSNSVVKLVKDSTCYIEVEWSDQSIDPATYKTIFVQGNMLTINDTTGKLKYYVHARPEQMTAFLGDITSDVLPAVNLSNYGQIGEEVKRFVDALVLTLDSVSVDPTFSPTKSKTSTSKEKKRQYSISDRTSFQFLWAFTNWGSQWYNGLMKLDGANNLYTSFSSYQLEEHFAVMMTKHWSLSVGVGYESDVYKMSNNYVGMGATGNFYTVDQAGLDAVSELQGSTLDGWSSRLVTRYVSLPITLQYRDMGMLNKFKMSLSVIPALGFNSSHTGLKHEYERKGRNYQEVEDVSSFLNPYKIDVRLTFQRKGLGIFLQVPTMPLFIDSAVKVYPIKLGFML